MYTLVLCIHLLKNKRVEVSQGKNLLFRETLEIFSSREIFRSQLWSEGQLSQTDR